MKECRLCPFNCGINRENKYGVCGLDNKINISKTMLHMWEEPCISGEEGSFAMFFTGCNLKCVFCQNYEISGNDCKNSKVYSEEELAELMLNVKEAHTISLISPTPYIPQIAKAIRIAKEKGLNKPIVYNTNSYENVESVKLLDGLIDIYLPDLKYFDDELSMKYSKAPKYFYNATNAILEMLKQVGEEKLIIRHLCLPGHIEDSKKILDWIYNNLPSNIRISLMAQYFPTHKANEYNEINRKITKREYDSIVNYYFNLGLENGFIQELEAASDKYVPKFSQ